MLKALLHFIFPRTLIDLVHAYLIKGGLKERKWNKKQKSTALRWTNDFYKCPLFI
jgi:hypothetical protein